RITTAVIRPAQIHRGPRRGTGIGHPFPARVRLPHRPGLPVLELAWPRTTVPALLHSAMGQSRDDGLAGGGIPDRQADGQVEVDFSVGRTWVQNSGVRPRWSDDVNRSAHGSPARTSWSIRAFTRAACRIRRHTAVIFISSRRLVAISPELP